MASIRVLTLCSGLGVAGEVSGLQVDSITIELSQERVNGIATGSPASFEMQVFGAAIDSVEVAPPLQAPTLELLERSPGFFASGLQFEDLDALRIVFPEGVYRVFFNAGPNKSQTANVVHEPPVVNIASPRHRSAINYVAPTVRWQSVPPIAFDTSAWFARLSIWDAATGELRLTREAAFSEALLETPGLRLASGRRYRLTMDLVQRVLCATLVRGGICERGVRAGDPCTPDERFPPFSVDCCRDLVTCSFDDPNNICSDPAVPGTCEEGKVGAPCVTNEGCNSFLCLAGDPNALGQECEIDLDCEDPAMFFDGDCGPAGDGVCSEGVCSGIAPGTLERSFVYEQIVAGADSIEFTTEGGILYSVSSRDPLLRTINPADGSTLSERAIQLDEAMVSGATGLASDPGTGELFALLKLEGQASRELVVVDPSTGQATSIGNTGDRFAGLAIGADGTLYGVTGDGAGQPATLFKIDRSDGTPTLLTPFATQGGDGEAIGFNPEDGLLYHASGLQPEELVFETIDPLLETKAALGLSFSGFAGLPGPLDSSGEYEEATAMAYAGSHRFLVADLDIPPHSAQLFLVEVPHVPEAFGQVCQRGPRSGASCTPGKEFPLFSTDCCTDLGECSVDDPNHACSPPLIQICEQGPRAGAPCTPDPSFPPFSQDCCRDLVTCSFDDPNNQCSSTPVRTCIAGTVGRLCASNQGCDTFVCLAGDPNTLGESCSVDPECGSPFFPAGDCDSAGDGVCDAPADPAFGICERGVRSGAPCTQNPDFAPFSLDCCRDLVTCFFDDPNNICSDPTSPRTCLSGTLGKPCATNAGCDTSVCISAPPFKLGESCSFDLECADPNDFFEGQVDCGSVGDGVCGKPMVAVGILGNLDHTSKGLAFLPDSDVDSRPNITDNCPFEPNNSGDDIQRDSDGNGRGDACECGNADGNTAVDIFDAFHIAQGTLVPPLVTMLHPRACDADGNGTCDIFDALRVAQDTLHLAEIVQECEAATVAPVSP